MALALGYASLLREIGSMETFASNEISLVGKDGGAFDSQEEYNSYFSRIRLQKLISLMDYKRKIEDVIKVLGR